MTDAVPDLFPRPRIAARPRPRRPRSPGRCEPQVDPSLPAQGYDLVVDASGARLTHADDAGRRYGEQTVAQLRGEDGALPAVHVRDWPDLPVRAYMLDVSRDRVPTRETLGRLVDVLATCRYNQLQLYVEHTFAYRDHEVVVARRLADHARRPPLARRRLRRRAASSWSATRTASATSPPGCATTPTGPGPSAPTASWSATASGCRPACWRPPRRTPTSSSGSCASRWPRSPAGASTSGATRRSSWARASSRARVEREGATVVYAEHLRRIVEPLLADGCSVQHWGDIIAHDPSALELLPAGDLTALVWSYEAPDAPRVEVADAIRAVFDDLGIDPDADTHFAGRARPVRRVRTSVLGGARDVVVELDRRPARQRGVQPGRRRRGRHRRRRRRLPRHRLGRRRPPPAALGQLPTARLRRRRVVVPRHQPRRRPGRGRRPSPRRRRGRRARRGADRRSAAWPPAPAWSG